MSRRAKLAVMEAGSKNKKLKPSPTNKKPYDSSRKQEYESPPTNLDEIFNVIDDIVDSDDDGLYEGGRTPIAYDEKKLPQENKPPPAQSTNFPPSRLSLPARKPAPQHTYGKTKPIAGRQHHWGMFSAQNNSSTFYGQSRMKATTLPLYGFNESRIGPGMVGLRNLGNSCYINASLQALLIFKKFIDEVCDQEVVALVRSMTEGNDSTYDAFFMFVQQTRDNHHSVVSPGLLKKMVGENNARFIGNAQEDAHEFISTLLNMLDEELMEKLKIKEGPSFKFFSLSLEHSLICSSCGHRKVITENYLDLSLELLIEDELTEAIEEEDEEHENEKKTEDLEHERAEKRRKKKEEQKKTTLDLRELIGHFLSVEYGVEWNCPQAQVCQSKEGRMEHKIGRLPRILMLHLKRFTPNLETNRFDKYDVPVNIPEKLDLRELVVDQLAGEVSTFKLRAIIIHIGVTINSGHFVCHARHDNGKYYSYNDSIVRDSNENDSFKGESAKRNAYILFYERDEVIELDKPN